MDPKIDTSQLLSQATPRTPEARGGQSPEKLRETARQFEAIFIQQMFKEMRRTVPQDGLLPRGNADDVYTQLQDLEAARITAQRGGIGLAELMMEQLTKER